VDGQSPVQNRRAHRGWRRCDEERRTLIATSATPPGRAAPAGGRNHSVYQRALGEQYALLDPHLQTYFGPVPHGSVGRGSGVYTVAGSRYRLLRPALAFLAWRRILFPELGINVPFTVINTPSSDGRLSAVRTFDFPRRTRVMEDTMTVINGQLHDRLGKRRGLEVALHLVVESGGLRMTSTRLALHVGRVRIPLPRVATMTLDERTDPTISGRQRVDVRITAPLLGEVFRYTGTFTYEVGPTG
jgi:hypothetical protein